MLSVLYNVLAHGKLYSDLTRYFPIQSSQGNRYILVIYNYDSNSIHVCPLKSRRDNDTPNTYQEIYSLLREQGLHPQLHWLDNKVSKVLKQFITLEEVQYQLAPPHIHCCNAAEHAIQTFKNHFITGLCTTEKLFPMHLWCRLLQHAEITMNLLQTSCLNPKLSAHAQVHGLYNFNTCPLAPPGTKCIAHEKPHQRGTWAPHGQQGWYVGLAPDHYRCYTL